MKQIQLQINEDFVPIFMEFSKVLNAKGNTLCFTIDSNEYLLSKNKLIENTFIKNEGMPHQSIPSKLDVTISNYLSQLGIPTGLSGFRYMITAVKKVLSDETVLDGITKILYPEIAEYHHSTPQRVEKSLRHAISVAWDNNSTLSTSENYHFFIKEGKKYPTNSQFIAEVSRQIKLTLLVF